MIGYFKIRLGQAKGLSKLTSLRVSDLFHSLDGDGDKAISKEELTKFLKTQNIKFNNAQIDEVIALFTAEGKVDEDGGINYADFLEKVRGRLE